MGLGGNAHQGQEQCGHLVPAAIDYYPNYAKEISLLKLLPIVATVSCYVPIFLLSWIPRCLPVF